MKNYLFYISALIVLSGCAGGFDDEYGQKGVGIFGSAYGYDDRRLDIDKHFVEFVTADDEPQTARDLADRRANELCVEDGFVRAETYFEAAVNEDGLLSIQGIAKCTMSELSTKRVSDRDQILERIKDLDASIQANENRLGMSNEATAMFSDDPTSLGIAVLVGVLSNASTNKSIGNLKGERQELIQMLQMME